MAVDGEQATLGGATLGEATSSSVALDGAALKSTALDGAALKSAALDGAAVEPTASEGTSADAAGFGRAAPGGVASGALSLEADAAGADVLEALSQIPDGLLLMNRAWQITYANPIGRRISRVRDEDMNGPTHWEIYPTTVGTEVERFYRRVMEGGPAEELEFFYPPFEAWLKVRAFPIKAGLALYYRDTTELHTAETTRDAALRQMEQAFAATEEAVLSLNREWVITYMNPAALRMTAPAGDVLGENLWHAFPEQVFEGSPYVETYYRAMVQREAGSFDAYYPEPLNLWVHVQARPADDGIAVFARDVTREHQAQEALRASEQQYRLWTELGPTAIWRGAADGSITYANKRFLKYIGERFTPGPGLSETGWLDAFAAEDRERVVARWVHSVTTGEVYDCEARLIRAKDGAVRWWQLRALPLRDEAGTITQWLGVANEIHDRKRAAERLQKERAEVERQRRELEAIYDAAPVGLALFEPEEFRYLRVNRRQAETLGRTVDELIGRRVDEVVTKPEVVVELFAKVAAGETVRGQMYSTEIVGRPGELRTFNLNYSPVFAEDGGVRAISAAVLDVTQQQKAEAALRQSEKLAAVGRLASSISHEINNPLEAVTNLLYLTGNEPGLSEAATEYVRIAQDEVRRVSQIATQTLRFHRQQNSPTVVSPAQLVEPVLNLFHGRLVNSGIHVEASYSTVRTVLCFEGDIRQILNNLIANAIDAMRMGGRLLVRAHDAWDVRSDTAGVRITVADTGHGMDAATLKRVFEPFYTTKDLNGNGLGLWISQGIVERHQGQLRVRSTQDARMHGTVFSMFLPSGAEPQHSE